MPVVTLNNSYTFTAGQISGQIAITHVTGPACYFRLMVDNCYGERDEIMPGQTLIRSIKDNACECQISLSSHRFSKHHKEPKVVFQPVLS